MYKSFHPNKIFVEKGITKLPVTLEILGKLPGVPIEHVDDYRKIHIDNDAITDVYEKSKGYLAIAKKSGELVKQFRRMDGLVGKREYFIVHGNNCFFDCKYCFIQNYFENAVPTLFVNHNEILDSIRGLIIASKGEKMLFHAGELCDSFLYDSFTKLSIKFVGLFSEFPDAIIDLRTKAVTIDNLLNVKARGNIIVSWTFSPQRIVDLYEHKAPPLHERIHAAEEVQRAGYNVGICLDPIIHYEGWFDGYKTMINTLFDRLAVAKIAYISLGGLRFLPSLAKVVRERNKEINLMSDEFVPCVDGKHRYFRPIRVDIYKKIAKIIRERSRSIKMYLCMETPEVWDDVTSEVDFMQSA